MSPRPRSNDPMTPMSVSIPTSLKMRLNNTLDYQQSRSKWIQHAIKAKLEAWDTHSQVISELSSKRLLTILFNRNVIDYAIYTALITQLDDSS